RNDEGEYELILDNKKLLSIFFVVVVLLGVGFTLGFVLGRSSGPGTAEPLAEKSASKPSDSAPTSSAAASPTKPDPAPSSLPPVVTEPAPGRSTESVTPREPEQEAKPDAAPAKPHKASSAAAAYRTGAPPAGSTFIQVASVSRSDAEMEATTLSEKGYPTWVAAGDKEDVFRVLVGPFADTASLSKAKASLEQLGFKRAFKKEYKK
ncbi:MAG: SPOR domain-containing protein, partial [Acidobacteria bacterium]|nr:SPOR domain-containing protein [Acidobacteriota bacterium]